MAKPEEMALKPLRTAAVKTGTSKDMRDNWCVGFSRRYAMGVWMGNFDGSPMCDVSGVTGAAPLGLETMNDLHPSGAGAPDMPSGIEMDEVSFDPQVYPGGGQIIAVDPDIPSDRQLVRFEALGVGPDAGWRLNGEAVKDGELWHPRPGQWVPTLHAADGRELDAVRFEVRGNREP